MRTIGWLAIPLALLLAGCSKPQPQVEQNARSASLNPKDFGKTADGKAVELYTLKNAGGMEVDVMTYGAIITSLRVPDRDGNMGDVVLGFDSLAGYLKDPPPPYFGAVVGRYGNRIANAKFSLDGKSYTLAPNNNGNSLHGGLKGFDKQVWTAKLVNPKTLELTYISKDGEEGYPGTLTTSVTYTVSDDNALRIDYKMSTDKATVHNITNHSYWNLAGEASGDVLNHEVTLFADKYTPVNAGLIPTGELAPVKGTPFDFTSPHKIGERIEATHEQIKFGKGYDHNWVLNGEMGTLRPAAKVTEATKGRILEVSTTEPGIQFYTGNFLDGSFTGKGGKPYQFRNAFCLETQHFPDSPNQPKFPTTTIKPGETYTSTTVFKFSAEPKR